MMNQETLAVIEQVAEDAAEKAVTETLTRLGLDINDPIQVQRDMAALRDMRELIEDSELQKDLLHLRRWRKTMDNVQAKGLMTLIGIVSAGVLAALWIGFKDIIAR